MHLGRTVSQGHYVAYRSRGGEGEPRSYLKFDDAQVTEVTASVFEQEAQKAYVLVYERRQPSTGCVSLLTAPSTCTHEAVASIRHRPGPTSGHFVFVVHHTSKSALGENENCYTTFDDAHPPASVCAPPDRINSSASTGHTSCSAEVSVENEGANGVEGGSVGPRATRQTM